MLLPDLDFGLNLGLFLGLNPHASDAVEVPRDGPDQVLVWETGEHFDATSVPRPSDAWLMQDEDTAITPAIGSVTVSEDLGDGFAYQQAATGWTGKLIGNVNPASTGALWRSPAVEALAEGESCIGLLYASFTAPSATTRVLMGTVGSGAANTGPAVRCQFTGGRHQPLVFSHGQTGALAVDHGGLSQVNGLLVVRNAEDDITAIYTPLGTESATHSEVAVSSQHVWFGQNITNLLFLFRAAYRWKGSDAAALIAAGLGNEGLLELAGFDMSSFAYPAEHKRSRITVPRTIYTPHPHPVTPWRPEIERVPVIVPPGMPVPARWQEELHAR